MTSENEAELGGFFENYQKATTMRTALEEMGQSQHHPNQWQMETNQKIE